MTEPCRDIKITDHALLRWMERVHGIDVPKWRDLMREDLDAALASYNGERDLDRPSFVIVEDRVVTVLSAGYRGKRGSADPCVIVPREAA